MDSYSGNDNDSTRTDDDRDKCGGDVEGYGYVHPRDEDDGWVGWYWLLRDAEWDDDGQKKL